MTSTLELLRKGGHDDEVNQRVAEMLGIWSWFVSRHDCFSVSVDGQDVSEYFPNYGYWTGYCVSTGKKLKMPKTPYGGALSCHLGGIIPNYTTSIDAQADLLPDGWNITSGLEFEEGCDKPGWARVWKEEINCFSEDHKTEAAARLDAILQVLENNNGQ